MRIIKKITVKFDNQLLQARKIEIIDLLGNIISELTTNNNVAVIDTRNLSQGVYLCRVVENSKVVTRKFVVK